MPSSPPESPQHRHLRDLTKRFDHAYEAAIRGDLERVQALLHETHAILPALESPATDDALARQLRTNAADSQGRLLSAMQSLSASTLTELANVRRGRKVLEGYGNANRALGRRLESRG